MLNPNTEYIIKWLNRMMNKTPFCGAVFPEVLAEYLNEAGNEDPSDEAVRIAKRWEEDLTLFMEYIEKSGKWCKAPTMGCIRYCSMCKGKEWKKELAKQRSSKLEVVK